MPHESPEIGCGLVCGCGCALTSYTLNINSVYSDLHCFMGVDSELNFVLERWPFECLRYHPKLGLGVGVCVGVL